jgi:hypothetical protein
MIAHQNAFLLEIASRLPLLPHNLIKLYKLCMALIVIAYIGSMNTNSTYAATITVQKPFYINIVGPIVAGDYDRFVSAIRGTRQEITTVTTVGPGGNVQEAIRVGRLIRKLNLTTEAPFTAEMNPVMRPQTCARASAVNSQTECTCASACTLIWFAGRSRFGNDLLIHSIKYDPEYYSKLTPSEASKQYRTGTAEIKNYLDEMDVPSGVFDEMFRMPSSMIQRIPDQTFLSIRIYPADFQEWLDARCRTYPAGTNKHIACVAKEANLAAINAVAEFRKEVQ